MFDFFKHKQTEAEKEAELRESIARKLANYTAPNEDTQATFTEVDFGSGNVKARKISIEAPKERDCWAEADPRDTTQWNKDNE